LNREGKLPDAMALARLYRERELVERLPDEDEAALATAPPTTPQPEVAPTVVERGKQYAQSPPMSAAEVRAAIRQLQVEFQTHDAYQVIDRPVRVEPTLVAPEVEPEPELEREGLRAAIAGILILLVVGGFIWLALYGPLRAPTPRTSPSPVASPVSR
jgi:hypothetical protein